MADNYGLFQDVEGIIGAELAAKTWFDVGFLKEPWFDIELIGAAAAAVFDSSTIIPSMSQMENSGYIGRIYV